MKNMAANMRSAKPGFTLIELLLVVTIIGMMLAVILPRALRASNEAKYSHVRQYASEIASYMTQWVQHQTEIQNPDSTYSPTDYLMTEVDPKIAGITNRALVNKYTGDKAFDAVEALLPYAEQPRNPFNEASYFNRVNNDTAIPSKKTGLLYLVSYQERERQRTQRSFFFIFTSSEGNWYGQMDHRSPDGIRRGVFAGRYSDTQPFTSE